MLDKYDNEGWYHECGWDIPTLRESLMKDKTPQTPSEVDDKMKQLSKDLDDYNIAEFEAE